MASIVVFDDGFTQTYLPVQLSPSPVYPLIHVQV